MCMRSFVVLPGLAALVWLLPVGVVAQSGQLSPAGVEVLARGPVHEAFAQVVDVNCVPPPVVAKQPPNLVEELPPDQRPEGENVQWIPGYWAWDEDQADYLWVSGIWRVPPPDRQWVPGHWQQMQGGWQWVSGLWLPLEQTELRIVPPPPPAPDPQSTPPPPDATSTYVPGIWVFQSEPALVRDEELTADAAPVPRPELPKHVEKPR
jgi:hypothetical protein